jgi:ketosteroid isomerase-like protein
MTDKNAQPSLEQRIARLEDIEEIRRLRASYHHYVNNRRFSKVSSLFCADGVCDLDYLGKSEGRDAIHASYLAMGARERFLIQQYPHNHMVDVDGDSATGYSYLDARYARFGVSYTVAGRYDDVYQRTPYGWRFARMGFEILFSVPAALGWAGDELHYLRPGMRPDAPAG